MGLGAEYCVTSFMDKLLLHIRQYVSQTKPEKFCDPERIEMALSLSRFKQFTFLAQTHRPEIFCRNFRFPDDERTAPEEPYNQQIKLSNVRSGFVKFCGRIEMFLEI